MAKIGVENGALLGISTAGEVPVIESNSASVGNDYHIVGEYLKILPRKDFSVTIADAIASPPSGWTWDNSANLDAADINTTTASALRMDHDATNTDWASGNYTAPFIYKTYEPNYGVQEWVARVADDADQNYEFSCLAITNADYSKHARIAMGFSSSNQIQLNVNESGIGGAPAITAQNRTDGVWMRIVLNAGDVYSYYSVANQATPPTAWTFLNRSTSWVDADTTIRAGILAHTVNTNDNFEIDILYFDDSKALASPYEAVNPDSCASGYDTGNTEIQILTDWDLVRPEAVVSQANVRAALASAENLLPEDAGSWTYSVVQDAATSASSSTFQASGSITISGTGRYLSIFAKCNSDGTQAGSLKLPVIIPAT